MLPTALHQHYSQLVLHASYAVMEHVGVLIGQPSKAMVYSEGRRKGPGMLCMPLWMLVLTVRLTLSAILGTA
jgi:hypothetical protein